MASLALESEGAEIFVPGGGSAEEALAAATHLGIGAHADDLEFMAFHGIEECRGGRGRFVGVVVTDGAGSVGARGDLVARRREEQREAARVGGYAAVIQLGWTSERAKDPANAALRRDLRALLEACHPGTVYTHNPADRHDTHVAVFLAAIAALREMPAAERPERVYGCEVWRDLDWLTGPDRVRLSCGADEEFAAKLNGAFRSQMADKRYDLAVEGRRRAHATFDEPREPDACQGLTLAMDLTPLVRDGSLDICGFALSAIDRFRADVADRLGRLG